AALSTPHAHFTTSRMLCSSLLMKVIVCTESEILGAVAVHGLGAEGHGVFVEARPEAFGDEVGEAEALLVCPTLAKGAIRILRERGFEGRALLFSDEELEPLFQKVAPLGADGALSASPLE